MTDVTDGTYPVQDGIASPTSVGVPSTYDLAQMLNETMKSRPAWNDLAVATSNVLFNYVEQTRVLLGAQRDSTNIGRVLKISLLRMMGLDWNSDSLTDDDYDRMIADVSLYCANHGTGDFVAFMGYSLGVPLDLITLWTQDYKLFGPENTGLGTFSTIFDAPPGKWYPTSHVGILFQEFAANASAADAAVITDIFYRIAPIHLVLQWVASEVTLSIGTLIASLNFYEHSEDTIDIEYSPTVYLYYDQRMYETTSDTAILSPLNPERDVWECIGAAPQDEGTDYTLCNAPAFAWGPALGVAAPLDQLGGYSVVSNVASVLTQVTAPIPIWTDPSGVWTGMLLQPSVTLLISSSGNPTYSTWFLNNITVAQTFTRYDGAAGFTVVSKGVGSYIGTAVLPSGTDIVMLTFRLNPGTSVVKIARGSQWVTYSTLGGVTSSASTTCACYPIGGGFYTLWGVMTGDAVTVYPISGGFDWLDFQVVQGRQYPVTVPSTVAAPGTTPVWTYFFLNDFNQDFNNDFGAGLTLPHNDFNLDFNGDFGWLSGAFWYFLNGETESSTNTNFPTNAELSVATSLAGNRCALPSDQLRQPYGIAIFDMVALYPEWVVEGTVTLFQAIDSLGGAITVSVSVLGVSATISPANPALAPYTVTAPIPITGYIRFGLSWTPTGTTLYVAGTAYPIGAPMSLNLTTAVIGAPYGSLANVSLVVRNLLLFGSTQANLLPGASYMIGSTT